MGKLLDFIKKKVEIFEQNPIIYILLITGILTIILIDLVMPYALPKYRVEQQFTYLSKSFLDGNLYFSDPTLKLHLSAKNKINAV